jgi:hypothetical protein
MIPEPQVSGDMRERIDELAEALVSGLDRSVRDSDLRDRLHSALRNRLADERFREFIVSRMDEPPSRTLEGLVLSYDPRLDLVDLAYKN